MGQVLSFNSVYIFCYAKYNNDKTQQSYSIFFSFLFCLVNGPSHETIKRKKIQLNQLRSFTNDA